MHDHMDIIPTHVHVGGMDEPAFISLNDTGVSDINSTWNSSGSSLNVTLAGHDIGCSLLTKFVVNTIIAGTICILGLIGNTVSFIVLGKDRESPVASSLLRALAFSDNFFLCTWFMHFTLNDFFVFMKLDRNFNVAWLYVRVYTYPLIFVGQSATIWLTVLIAISRYVAVCKPYKAFQYCTSVTIRKAILAVAVFAIIYNLPRFFEVKITRHSNSSKTHYTLARTPGFGDNRHYSIIYFDVLYYIFSFVLPLIMLVFLNTKLTLAYRRVTKRRNSMRLRTDHPEHNITLVMIIVVLVFILCNAPARVVQIIWRYQIQKCLTTEFMLMEISNVLEVLNSSTNFIIYCVFRHQFRQILTQRFCAGRSSDSYLATGLLPTATTVFGNTVAKEDEANEAESQV